MEFINGGTLEQLIRPFYCLSTDNNDNNSICEAIVDNSNGKNDDLIKLMSTPIPNNKQQSLTNSRSLPATLISPKVHRLRDPDWTFVKLMRDVVRGMSYLHSMGYLHRDLASKNIFIRKRLPPDCDTTKSQFTLARSESKNKNKRTSTSSSSALPSSFISVNDKEVVEDDDDDNFIDNDSVYSLYDDNRLSAVIGDFGFATAEPTSRDQKLSIVGSPYWLAPECFKNLWYNHKCDIYSFGVICCELNWRIPADPDYLPRCDDTFVVDFDKLNTRQDTILGKVSRLACQVTNLCKSIYLIL